MGLAGIATLATSTCRVDPTKLPRPAHRVTRVFGQYLSYLLGNATPLIILTVWGLLHLLFFRRFIFHDSWQHIFPVSFNVMHHIQGFTFPMWLTNVDGGSPVILYSISMSLQQVIRTPFLFLGSWLGLGLPGAVYYYKLYIFVTYAVMCAGLYCLGRLLFKHRLAAVFLFATSLFSGLSLETLHSDQSVSILFWLPWLVASAVLFHRSSTTSDAARYANLAVLFACLQALDQYPHFLLLAAAVAAVIYFSCSPEAFLVLRRIGWRLWPAVLIVTATVVQLMIVRDAIAAYQPSLRSSLVVSPATFGETGFVQPTALAGSFLPLTFVTAFETLAESMQHLLGRRYFIFRLNSLVFIVGFLPLVFAAFFLFHGRSRRWRFGLMLFTLSLLLIALQQSRLYLVLGGLPGFDVFRSYFLYVLFVAIAVLLMSGFGFDEWLGMVSEERRRTTRHAIVVTITVAGCCAAAMLWLLATRASGRQLQSVWLAALGDVLTIMLSIAVLWRANRTNNALFAGSILIFAVIGINAVVSASMYVQLGITVQDVLSRYRIWGSGIPRWGDVDDPEGLRRRECTRFAECYMTGDDTLTLRTDLEGTFLRHRRDIVFLPGAKPDVVRALTALTHPIFWLSERAAEMDNDDAIVTSLNKHADTISEHLRKLVYVRRGQAGGGGDSAGGRIVSLVRFPGYIRVEYEARGRAWFNAAVTFDDGWKASVNGQSAHVVRGNVNGLAIQVVPGTGTLELRYRTSGSSVFFTSRYILVLVGALGVLVVILPDSRRGVREP